MTRLRAGLTGLPAALTAAVAPAAPAQLALAQAAPGWPRPEVVAGDAFATRRVTVRR